MSLFSASATYVGRIAIIVVVMLILAALPFPSIQPYLIFIQDGVNMLYFMNPIMDMDTAFGIIKFILTVEFIYYGYKLLMAITHFVTTGHFSSGKQTIQADENEEI